MKAAGFEMADLKRDELSAIPDIIGVSVPAHPRFTQILDSCFVLPLRS
jgi:hypothetical protein